MGDARRWVADIFRSLGRTDLVESAQLAVSELVTNALLHGDPPLTLRVRGTRAYPRIEVADGSPDPPRHEPPDDEDLLSTIGRGLSIVAMCSRAWGATLEGDGKVVWCVPNPDPDPMAPATRELVELGGPAPDPVGPAPDLVRIQLLGLPVPAYLDFRNHYRELHRELRLLALADAATYPLARHLSDQFSRFEAELPALLSLDLGAADERPDAGPVEVTVAIPRGRVPLVHLTRELLELADTFCRSERLLAVATSPEQQEFERWLLGEVIRQCSGEEPRRWAHRETPSHRAS